MSNRSREVVATYRNEEKEVEVDIERDSCASNCPFDDEVDWLSFPALRNQRFRVGTEVLDEDEIRAAIKETREDGGIALPVEMQEHGELNFRASADDYEAGDCGVLIVRKSDLSTVGLDREAATAAALKVLERYSDWANGRGYGFACYKVKQCSLEHFHRVGGAVEQEGGYVGTNYQDTGILEEAGIRSGNPPTMSEDWVQVSGE